MDTKDEWGRLAALPDLGNRAGIYTTGGDIRVRGRNPLSLGLVDLGAARHTSEPLEIPVLADLALSVVIPGEISLISAKANAFRRDHPVIGTGVFDDEHPAHWLASLAEFDQAVIVYTPGGGPCAFPDLAAWMDQWHIGLVPVAYRLDFDGFSMLQPGLTLDLGADDR